MLGATYDRIHDWLRSECEHPRLAVVLGILACLTAGMSVVALILAFYSAAVAFGLCAAILIVSLGYCR